MILIGIYAIINTANGKKYIGSSTNIKKREYTHFSCLRRNKHVNNYLQNAYNKYGKELFVFNIIEVTKHEILFEREQYWINMLKSSQRDFGYNIEHDVINNVMSEETKIKIRETIKLQYINGRKVNFKDEKHTVETKKIIGYKSSQKELTDKYLAILDNANKFSNQVCYKPVLQFDKNGNFIAEHKSINSTAEFIFPELSKGDILKKRKSATIGRCCNKKNKTAFGYKFQFKNEI